MEKGQAAVTDEGTTKREEGRDARTQQINPLTLMRWSGGISVSARGTWRRTLAGRTGQ